MQCRRTEDTKAQESVLPRIRAYERREVKDIKGKGTINERMQIERYWRCPTKKDGEEMVLTHAALAARRRLSQNSGNDLR